LEINTETHPGALSISDGIPVVDAEPIPEVTEIHQRLPEYTLRGCGQKVGEEPGCDEVIICDDPDAPANPTARVVLAAGSHAGHGEDAFRSIGQAHGWLVVDAIKSRCVFQYIDSSDPIMCQLWNDNLIELVQTSVVDLVITSDSRVVSGDETI